LGIVLAAKANADLPVLVLAICGAPLLAQLVSGCILFGWQRPWLRPRLSQVKWTEAIKLARIGAAFFLLQTLGLLTFSLDNIIVAHVQGSESVAGFAIASRLFAVCSLVLGIFLAPLWPAYRESISRGDVAWAKTALVRSLSVTAVLTTPVVMALTLWGRPLISVWVGNSWLPSSTLLGALAAQTIVSCLALPVSMMLNGAGALRFQLGAGLAVVLVGIPLKIYWARTIGLEGIPAATAITQALLWLIPVGFFVAKHLKLGPMVAARTNHVESGG
jgi:O-antigen/teichoic acid export membrane protein